MHCPLCNSTNIANVEAPAECDCFALMPLDSEKKTIHADSPIPVQLFACTNCGHVFMHSDFFVGKKIEH